MQIFAKKTATFPHFQVVFRTVLEKGEKGPFPTVSLSRIEGKCLYELDKLHEHDNHAAEFTTKDADEYISRVMHSIEKALGQTTEWQMIYTDKKEA